jgi:hypothetical protein
MLHAIGSLQAEILARFRPELDVSSLIPSIREAEQSMEACLRQFRATRHMILYYEDLIRDDNVTEESAHCHSQLTKKLDRGLTCAVFWLQALSRVQKFLGVPVRPLSSRHVKIHTSPLPDLVDNWEEVRETLRGTEFHHFLDG